MFPIPSLRAVLFRLHWVLGLTCGLVLAVIGATGALLAYEEAITSFADRAVAAQAGRGPRLSPSVLVGRIEAERPGSRVAQLTVAGDEGAPATARFARQPATGQRPPSLLVDPTDGRVLGPVRLEAFFGTVRSLHRWLLIPGDGRGWGRTVTGICTIALLLFVATGLVLRWPARHRWRVWLRPTLTRPGRARWWSLHAVVGTWLAPVYLVSAVTGATWSYPAWKDATTWLLTGEAPRERPAQRGRMNRGGESGTSGASDALDRAWAAFAAGEGREFGLAILILPERDAGPIRIRWLGRGEDPSGGYDQASFDGSTGAPLAVERRADKPVGRRMAETLLEVHRGRFFGSLPAVLFALAAFALPGFAATGLVLWLLRRRAGRPRPASAGRVAARWPTPGEVFPNR